MVYSSTIIQVKVACESDVRRVRKKKCNILIPKDSRSMFCALVFNATTMFTCGQIFSVHVSCRGGTCEMVQVAAHCQFNPVPATILYRLTFFAVSPSHGKKYGLGRKQLVHSSIHDLRGFGSSLLTSGIRVVFLTLFYSPGVYCTLSARFLRVHV